MEGSLHRRRHQTDKGPFLRPLVRAILVAVILRAAMVLLTRDAPLLIDMEEYHRLAVSLVDGNGYSGPSGPTAFRPPFYPAFLAFVYWITGGPHVLAARLVQAMLGGAEVWLTYRVVLSLGLRGVALPAAWIVALYPSRTTGLFLR